MGGGKSDSRCIGVHRCCGGKHSPLNNIENLIKHGNEYGEARPDDSRNARLRFCIEICTFNA